MDDDTDSEDNKQNTLQPICRQTGNSSISLSERSGVSRLSRTPRRVNAQLAPIIRPIIKSNFKSLIAQQQHKHLLDQKIMSNPLAGSFRTFGQQKNRQALSNRY